MPDPVTPTTPAPTTTPVTQTGFTQGAGDGVPQVPPVMTLAAPGTAPTTNPGGTAGVQGLPPEMIAVIEAARTQERDKLYPTIDQLKEEMKELRLEREQRIAEAQAASDHAAEEERLRQEAEMNATQLITARSSEWESKFAEQQTQLANALSIMEMERTLSQVTAYRSQAMEAASEEILPELRDMVTGNTSEEIDQSIASLRERSAAILGNMQLATVQARTQMQGVSVTAPPVGPQETNSANVPVTADDLRKMDLSTYQKNRDALLASLHEQVAQHGIYGTQ